MKRLKYSGLAYHNRSNKDIAAKKAPSFEVFCKCKYECRKLPYEQKIFLFEDYYKIANHVKQKSYLLGLIQIGSVKRRRHGKYESAEQSRRQATAWYTVPNGNGQHVQLSLAISSGDSIKIDRAVAVDAGIRIVPKSEDDCRKIIRLFEEENVPHHTFPSTAPLSVTSTLLSEESQHQLLSRKSKRSSNRMDIPVHTYSPPYNSLEAQL
ncbi:unnamed protein product [Acanthoscelides obtectus]|uniref:Uncharacterized protein n=1 Tax=Acanthoscelides obtectus TaxID=200917 RepID=A0A9P0P0Q0_ACAOB|nr:unnamed protein product [Acanthoscelides obtectus]CAK1623773.1 hypothetical protein AOBTE_LOCUS2171 [Acanthoscelides obtectus]